MCSTPELMLDVLESAYQLMKNNLQGVTLEEALFVPPGGYRSVLGTLKHAAGWSHVYRSYAFDLHPQAWSNLDWPCGLRDTIIPSEQYFQEVQEWFDAAHRRWRQDLANVSPEQWDELRPLHWGEQVPLAEIVIRIAQHHVYHAGELNQLLSIYRGEAWEETEEVEENNISTIGHRVRPPWRAD